MDVSSPVALSGQLALQKRLNSIANNVANSRTTGFRAEGVRFSSNSSHAFARTISYASVGENFFSRNNGPVVKTDNPLDIAIKGDAWLAVKSPTGTVYTRDGRMRMSPDGQLQTLTGYPVFDVGGSPIQLDVKAGPPKIASDGMITQGDRQVGAIGLYSIGANAKLRRFDTSSVIPDSKPEGIVDFSNTGVLQGFVEQSNVNAVMEMSRLIEVSRAFEMLNSFIRERDQTSSEAVRTLGSTS